MAQVIGLIDGEGIRARVEAAQRQAGAVASLVGYDANGIQEFVTASSRPIAMQGASSIIREFDSAVLDRPGTIFAGGGRGTLLVRRDAADSTARALAEQYRGRTQGGVLAVAAVPWSDDVQGSLAWLRLRLGLAKDSAPAPAAPLPGTRQDQCSDCRSRLATRPTARPESPGELVCERCHALVEAGRRAAGPARWTLEEISTEGKIAVVSADGNNLGGLFARIGSLEEMAAVSAAVAGLFDRIHQDAVGSLDRFVAPVTGGDDIRIFLPPEHAIEYVERLAAGIQARGQALDECDGLISGPMAAGLRNIGIGIGVVVADYHYPASRLIEFAHEVELSAKRRCREDGKRSAMDFVLLKSGQEFVQGLNALERPDDPRPFAMDEVEWPRWSRAARELARVPGAQRGAVTPGPLEGPEEHRNFFRAQVARHPAWQNWFRSCGVDWRDRQQLDQNMPGPALLELAELMEMGR